MSTRAFKVSCDLTLRECSDSIALSRLRGREMGKTETLNLRVSVEFKRRLVEEAKKEKRSVTNYIEAALTELWNLRIRELPVRERKK